MLEDTTVGGLSSESVIGLMRKISPSINDYMLREMYIYDAETIDNVSEAFIQAKCLDILLDELLSMGIILDSPMDGIIDNQDAIRMLAILRDVMSTASLKTTLSSCDSVALEEIESLMMPFIEDDHPAGLFISLFIEKLESWFPISEKYSTLVHWSGSIVSTKRFLDHLHAVLEMVRSSGEPSVLNDFNTDLVVNYISILHNRKMLYERVIRQIIEHDQKLNRVVLFKEMENYNVDLCINRNILVLARKYFKHEMTQDELKMFDIIRAHHRKQSMHHIEHYKNEKYLTYEEEVLVVAALITANMTKLELEEAVNNLYKVDNGLMNKDHVNEILSAIDLDSLTTI